MDASGILLECLMSICAGRFPFCNLPPVLPLLLPCDGGASDTRALPASGQARRGVRRPGARRRCRDTAEPRQMRAGSQEFDASRRHGPARWLRLGLIRLGERLRLPMHSRFSEKLPRFSR
jgi:hypothetical protein